MSTKITIRENGPLLVEGPVEICDASGKAFGLGGRAVVGLCRCGASANKPFCDGAHKGAGFADCCEARELPPPVAKA